MTPNGMQGSWTRPALTSPVRPAVLAALPEDGSPITRKELLAKARALCPDRTVGTISVYINDMGTSPVGGVTRVGYGLYRRTTPKINAAGGEHPA